MIDNTLEYVNFYCMSIDFNNDAFKARLDELEKKWLAGTISKEEMDEYAIWYNQEQNKKVIVPEEIAQSYDEHEQKILNNILQAVDIKPVYNNAKKDSVVLLIKKYWKYGSAAAVLIILISIFYFNNDKSNKNREYKSNNLVIAPGKDGMNWKDANGKVIEMDQLPNNWLGDVSGISVRKKDNSIVFGKNKLSNIYNIATTKKGQQFRIVLPDGSKIYLNSQSSVKFPISMNDATRMVEMSGEVYFEVVHNENVPFIVKVNGIEIRDIGTKFNVNSFNHDENSTVTLIEGAIQATSQFQKINLEPNQSIIWDKSLQLNSVNIDTATSVAWTRKIFSFNEATLQTIAQKLSRWYNVDVKINSNVDSQLKFSGGTPMNQDLQEVLNVLSYGGIHYKLIGNNLEFLP